MANQDLTKGNVGATKVASYPSGGRHFVVEFEIDCSVNPRAAADVVNAIRVPPGHRVAAVRLNTLVVAGLAGGIDVGDAVNSTGFIAVHNGNAVGASNMVAALTEGAPNTITGYSTGKVYDAEDTIDLVFAAADVLGKHRLTVELVDLS